MSSTSSTKVIGTTVLCCVLILIGKIPTLESSPNIVFIMFDDLSFSELSYNGGLINTTIIDGLAETGIRLNSHYSEQVCSPSRAAFMTGRYSWRSGLNSLAGMRKNAHFDPTAVLFPELLNDAGYNLNIAGKWHIGYKYDDILPFNRGFESGLYGHVGTGYYDNEMNIKFSKIDVDFPLTNGPLKNRRKCVFNDRKLPTFDLYEIVKKGPNYKESAVDIHTDYVDDLYANQTRYFIADQSASTPFMTILNLFTPHASTTQPPNVTIWGDSVVADYSTICGIPTITDTNKTLICKQLVYSERLIQGIIDELKTQNLYSNTILIIASDNGGAPDSADGLDYADVLPFRGRKSGPFEGGVRTSSIVTGGYIENNVLASGDTDGCGYNNLMHISDWYHLFMKVAHINTTNTALYVQDSDHQNLEIWEDIGCVCDPTQCSGSPFTQRTELIQIQTCETETHSTDTDFLTATAGATAFFSSYIRKTIDGTEYKLVRGGSSDLISDCPLVTRTQFNHVSSYVKRTGAYWSVPNWQYYTQYYNPFNTSYPELYGSKCLDDIIANNPTALNNTLYGAFQYNDSLLYKIAEDRVEACDVGSSERSIQTQLEEALQNASSGYLVSDWNALPSIGAFYEQLMSYKCLWGTTLMVPWEGNYDNGSLCNVSRDASGEITNVWDCNDIWRVFVRKAEVCCENNPDLAHCATYCETGGTCADSETASNCDLRSEVKVEAQEIEMIATNSKSWFQSTVALWITIVALFIVALIWLFTKQERKRQIKINIRPSSYHTFTQHYETSDAYESV